jgi:hypothetical protein
MGEWAVRALGVFWFVGGMMTLRALRMDRALDTMFAAIRGGIEGKDLVRASLLGFGAVLTVLTGVALVALDRFAPALLVVNAGSQAAWLLYAARAFPPEDDDDRIGRVRVRNAFVFWCVATVVVIAAERAGVVALLAWPDAEVAAAAIGLAVLVWQGVEIVRMGRVRALEGAGGDAETGSDLDTALDPSAPRRWILGPNLFSAPLWDADTNATFYPDRLALPAEVIAEIEALEAEVREKLRPSEDGEVYVFMSGDRAAFAERAEALAEKLKDHLPGGEVDWSLPPEEG